MTYIKGFMTKVTKHLKENNADRVDGFKEGAKEFVGWVTKNFDEFTL